MTDDDHSLRLIAALTRIWNAIRARHPEVPPVVLLPAPSPAKSMNVLGHFAPLRWSAKRKANDQQLHEVLVVAEHLDRAAEDVLKLCCTRRRTPSTSSAASGTAAEASITTRASRRRPRPSAWPSPASNYGFSLTLLLPETALRYEAETAALREALICRTRPLALPGPGPSSVDDNNDDENDTDGEDGPRTRHLKATCACPFVIRLSKKT